MKNKMDFSKLILLYIIIQPFIDIVTTLIIVKTNYSLSPGIIVRSVFLIISTIYIIINSDKKYRIYIYTYFIALGLFVVLHLYANYNYKVPFYFFEEIKQLVKYLYFPIVLLLYILVFNNKKEYKEIIIKYSFICLTVISSIILIGLITNTGIQSYGSAKIGQIGWFFSGTKISAAMAILFPISILYATKKSIKDRNYKYWFMILLAIVSMFITGTKTSYCGIIGGLLAGFGAGGIDMVLNKNRNLKFILIILMVLITSVGIYTPYSPVYKNINIHKSWDDSKEPDIIFNGREIKLEDMKQQYSDTSQEEVVNPYKILGLGYGGNYISKNDIKPIERDYHELYYYYGIIGLFLILFVSIVVIINIIKRNNTYKKIFNLEFILIGTSIILAVGCGYIAGHVISAPSVSIYLILSMTILYNR